MDRRPRHRLVASRRPLKSALVALGIAAAAALLVSVTGAVFSSTFSNPASSLTAVSLDPYIPASVSVSRVDASTCRVTWTASATAGAPAGLTYDVTDGTTTLASNVAALTVDLTTGADVAVRVLARAGTWVSAASRTAPGGCGGPPSAPTGLAATAGDQQVAATWNAATAHGTPVTGYTLAATPTNPATGTATGAASTCTASNPATGCTVTGLTNGSTYALTVTAASAWGASPASSGATAIPYPAAVMSAANLRLWLDGADTGTMAQDAAGTTAVTGAGQPVGRWTDKSGQTDASGINSADQSTAASRPTTTLVNGRPVPGFDGSSDWLGVRAPALLPSGTTPSTEVVVAALTDPTPSSSSFRTAFKHGTNTTNQSRSFYKGSSSANLVIDTHGANALVSGTWSATSQIVVGQFSTTELALRVSGRPAATLTPSAGVNTSTASATVGNSPSFFWQGPIPEVVVFTGTLTPTQIRTVEEYLARKWATSMTPSAPTGVGATPGNATAAVTWAAPSWDGGSPVTGYTATASPGGATCTASGAAATGCTLTGLTNGTAYSITVTAANAVGTGPASGSASATPRTVPGAPTGVTATPGVAQATVSWTAPASNGGSAVTGYTATATPAGGGGSLGCTSAGTSCTISGLTNGVTYTVTVTASNVAGAGPASSGVTTTPADYAAQVTATPGLVGYWKLADAPGSSSAADSSGQNHPGTVITGVTFGTSSRPMPADTSTTAAFAAGVGSGISVGDPGGVGGVYDFAGRASFSVAGWVRAGAPAYGNTFPDLLYKKRYVSQSDQEGWHVYLDDTQATSWSPGWIGFARFSAAVYTGVTAPLPLSTWTHVVATYDGTSMKLYFNSELVASGTSTSSVIDTAQALVIGRHWEDLLAHVSVWNIALTPAQVGTLYTQTGSPVAATAPQAPRNPSATAGTSQATVSWSAPAYSGLSPVTSYTATASPGGATCTTTGSPPATGCTITGLTGGTTYTVTVTATNAVGTGPASSSVSVTPHTVPGAPTGVALTPSESQLAASWTAPASNGGSAVTGYTATATATGFPTRTCTTAGSPPATGCTITGLTNGVTYTVSVTATNALGTGTASTAATGVPYPSTIMTASATKVWLDAQQATTLFSDTAGTTPTTTGGAVQRWKHRLGSGWDALKPSPAGSPTLGTSLLNGKPAVRFDRTHPDYLEITNAGIGAVGSADRTQFVVAAARTTADNTTNSYGALAVWPGYHSGLTTYGYPNGDQLTAPIWSSTPAIGNAGTPSGSVSTSPFLGTTVARSSGGVLTSDVAVNGHTFSSASVSGSWYGYGDLLRIGAANVAPLTNYQENLDGDIGELIVLNRAITAAERRTIEEYLARKWSQAIAPSAPAGVGATAGNATAAVTWAAPSWNGGSAVTGYTATASPGGATCTASGAAATGCTLTGLTNGTTYSITVTAANAVGTGPASGSTSATPTGPPGAPTAVTLTPADGSIAAAWTAPTSNGGSTITSYTATASPGGATCTSTGSPAAPGCTLTGLTNGTTYSVTVTATNALGTGSASTAATAVPYPSTIMTTARMRLWLDGADTTTLFQDTAGTTPATTAGQGVARWNDKSGQAGHALQATAGNRPTLTTVNGRLVPGFNGTTSFLSADVTKLPTGTTVSTSFVAAKLTGDFSAWGIGLIWGNESTGAARSHFIKPDGSVCLDGYSATQACGGVAGIGDSIIMAGQVTGTGVSLGVNGAPQVASAGGSLSTGTGFARIGSRVGVSFWPGPIPEVLVFTGTLTSTERRTVEEYLARKWAMAITPRAPTGVTAVRGSGQATVGWTVPSWNGGSAVTGYTATASPGGATCTASGAAATGCTLTGLTNGTAYTVTVTATNAAGTGPASSSASVP